MEKKRIIKSHARKKKDKQMAKNQNKINEK